MTMASLMPPHDTIDALHRTTGPNRVSQKRIHPAIETLPLWIQSLTQHLLNHDQLQEPNAGLTLPLPHMVLDIPQAG
jgi:hypothetical protein